MQLRELGWEPFFEEAFEPFREQGWEAARVVRADRHIYMICGHASEPGCAVQQALEDGTLDAGRWQSYRKLQRELRHLARKQDLRARQNEKAKWKQITVAHRKRAKGMGRYRWKEQGP